MITCQGLELSRQQGFREAALWLTFQLRQPAPDGPGRVPAAGRRAALDRARLIEASGLLELCQPPGLDIVCYSRPLSQRACPAIDRASAATLAYGMKEGDRSVYLSTLRITANAIGRRHDGIEADRDGARILRSVLMKPEAEGYVRELPCRVECLVAGSAG